MSSATYMTDVSKGKQCGPNQTAPLLEPLFLRSTRSKVNNVSKYSRYIFGWPIWVNIVKLTLKNFNFKMLSAAFNC